MDAVESAVESADEGEEEVPGAVSEGEPQEFVEGLPLIKMRRKYKEPDDKYYERCRAYTLQKEYYKNKREKVQAYKLKKVQEYNILMNAPLAQELYDKLLEQSWAKGNKSLPDPTKHYACVQCRLLYTAEEIAMGRYSWQKQMCLRCITLDAVKEGKFFVPECFGKHYSAANPLCAEQCTLKQACIIETVEMTGYTTPTQLIFAPAPDLALRILRAYGSPLHLFDLAALLSKVSDGKFAYEGMEELKELKIVLRKLPQVMWLGQEYMVWIGVWRGGKLDKLPQYSAEAVQHVKFVPLELRPKREKLPLPGLEEEIAAMNKAEEVLKRQQKKHGQYRLQSETQEIK